MKGKIVVFFLFVLIFISTSQQTRLRGNLIMLTVDNSNGSFNLYGRNSKDDKWIPLLFEDFPPTSYFRFVKDGKQISFGESGKGNYSEINSDKNGIYYFWKNNEVKIDINFRLFSSSSSNPVDSLLIDLTINNLTERETNLDFSLCIDTYLGEKENNHFITPNNKIYNKESIISKKDIPEYILSYSKEKGIGVNIILNKSPILPDRIFFANWKIVRETIGKYKINPSNSFDLKPFSINDSATFIEYENQKIGSKSRNYKFILSMKNRIKLEETSTTTTIQSYTTTTISNSTTTIDPRNLNLINMNLFDLLRLLDEINKKIESGQKLTQEDIDFSNAILEEIKKRRNKYNE